MVHPLHEWNPFHLLLERDSSHTQRADLSFLKNTKRVPVVGLCYVEQQNEYGERQRHNDVFDLVNKFVKDRNLATIKIDTRWPEHRNQVGLSSPEQIISIMERVDIIITNRLHGLVFSLKSGTPVIAIDGIQGGDKVSRQAATLEWPACETIDTLDEKKLEQWFSWCMSNESKKTLHRVTQIAKEKINLTIKNDFMSAFDKNLSFKKIPENTLTPDDVRPSLRERLKGKVRWKVKKLKILLSNI